MQSSLTKKKQVWPNYNIEKHLLRPGLSFFSFKARRYFVENLPSLKTLSSLPFFDLFRALTKGKSSRDTPRLFLLFYFPTRKASGEQIKTGPPCSTHKKCHFFLRKLCLRQSVPAAPSFDSSVLLVCLFFGSFLLRKFPEQRNGQQVQGTARIDEFSSATAPTPASRH